MTTKTTRFCGQCGESAELSDKFCTACGSTLVRQPPSVNKIQLPAPAVATSEPRRPDESTGKYVGGMAWSDRKGSFEVPDVPPPQRMNFAKAVKHCLRNYANFRGRASRSEYWYFVSVYFIIWGAVWLFGILAPSLAASDDYAPEAPSLFFSLLIIIAFIATLAIVIPALAASVRRLHDTGRSAAWYLLNFIPFAGIVVLIFLCQEGDEVPNRFGPP
jgi:uncharacterized membrane protein YhaH (DUF805 family)